MCHRKAGGKWVSSLRKIKSMTDRRLPMMELALVRAEQAPLTAQGMKRPISSPVRETHLGKVGEKAGHFPMKGLIKHSTEIVTAVDI